MELSAESCVYSDEFGATPRGVLKLTVSPPASVDTVIGVTQLMLRGDQSILHDRRPRLWALTFIG